MGSNHERSRPVKKPNGPDDDWQRIWLSARQRDWSSLVLVPSDATVDIVQFAESLARTGRNHAEWPVRGNNGPGVQVAEVGQWAETYSASTARGDRAMSPFDPDSDNPATIAILHATSAALLIVSLGESLIAAAQTTIETVGRDRM